MNITPRPWTWTHTRLAEGWLNQCLPDLPVVWQAGLTDDTAMLSDLVSLLSADEHARLGRLKQHDDRQRFLIGRGLLRLFVGAQLGLPPDGVKFQYGPFGKPSLILHDGTTPFHFNVSHSGNLVVLAFHPAREVGVDVEEMREGQDWEAVVQRVFPAEEYRNWTRLKPDERTSGFFRGWTRHEALLKTLGLGFFDESGAEHDARLSCFDLEMPESYQGAVGCLR
ncbi:MAG TPA: 4'-phosphopantetheinyl transferase superfamily protein [Verrucomicrobiae bacterium]|jgi:4'-phosphopantetheinyl transferase|nr:4'-phosphopantetheinyl transferase superfamily protein [Verrucomicrobiae bacterium]